jgi:hypothetical protein
MRCTRAEKFLPLYVAGDLAGRRAERLVVNHLAACERCRGLAAEFETSRNLVRAATLPPEFDGAFYEEIRRSVLAEIERERPRLAPPTSARFASLFNARFAYAAAMVFVIAAVAALSLYSYVGRKSEEDTHSNMLANANRQRNETPATTPAPVSTQAKEDARQTSSPVDETAWPTKRRESQAAKSPSEKRRANNGHEENATQQSVKVLHREPSYAKRNPLAPSVGATDPTSAGEIASRSDGETDAAPEVSRIEIQTSDPNIRIIWLSPKPDAVAQPLK